MTARGALLALITAALLVTGCDGDDNGPTTESTDGGTPTTESTDGGTATAAQPQEGCTASHPYRADRPGKLAGLFRACVNEDGSSLQVANTSSGSVLVVSAADSSAPPDMLVPPVSSSSPAGLAVNEAVPSGCGSSSSGPCKLVPGATLSADGNAPVQVLVDLDVGATMSATVASGLASYAASKLQSRALRYQAAVSTCAQSVGKLAKPNQFVEDAARNAVEYGATCGSLVKQIAAEASEPLGRPATVADDALRMAGRFTSNIRRDLYVYEAIRLATRLR
jgi:hypothetical protein